MLTTRRSPQRRPPDIYTQRSRKREHQRGNGKGDDIQRDVILATEMPFTTGSTGMFAA